MSLPQYPQPTPTATLHFSLNSQPFTSNHEYDDSAFSAPQKQQPQPPQQLPTTPIRLSAQEPRSDHDMDLELGLAPLSLVSSVSSTAYPSPEANAFSTSPITPVPTRNFSTSHLLVTSSNEKLAGLQYTCENVRDAAWPTREELLQEKKAVSKQKCNGVTGRIKKMRLGLSKKQIMWMKILIGMMIVGLAVGLGIGISRKVGGGVWGNGGK